MPTLRKVSEFLYLHKNNVNSKMDIGSYSFEADTSRGSLRKFEGMTAKNNNF